MPISAIYNVKGGTLAQYDRVIKALGDQFNSSGALAHIATATPDGFLVFDVWETQAAFDSFVPHLRPCVEAAGIASQSTPMMGRVERMLVSEDVNNLPAVAIFYSFPGMTVERYHDVLNHVKYAGHTPATRRAHIASRTADGMFVIAVWESEAAFREFEPALNTAFVDSGVGAVSPVIGQIHRIGVTPGAAQRAHA